MRNLETAGIESLYCRKQLKWQREDGTISWRDLPKASEIVEAEGSLLFFQLVSGSEVLGTVILR